MSIKEISISDLSNFDVFKAIGKDWMLITAGDESRVNTMTASWGGFGVLWNKNVSYIFVRPQRYTFKFLENSKYYSLSFFGNENKKILSYCGSHSGKDVDKISETGLKVIHDKAPYFEQSKLTFICKKLYSDFIDPIGFKETSLQVNYENNDYHKMYVGEIIKCLIKE